MDTIIYEIIRSSLYAIAREMKVAMTRTAGSPIIHSGGDASAAIFDADMQLIAQGNDIPTMLGSAVISTRVSVEAVGRDRLRPGDVIISNDAYLGGGNHQSDVQFTRPVFVEGEIVAYTMTRGHWSDIGGQSPGSYAADTWDIFGEGVRIPPVRLYRNDELVEDVQTLILQNTRDPQTRLLDVQAQYAGCYVGDQRLSALARKYGVKAMAEAMTRALDHSEALMRDAIRKIPDGVYTAEDEIDAVYAIDGVQPTIPIKVTVTKKDDEIEFDYTGSGGQVRGGVNCPLSVTCNSTWFTVKAITDVSIPINQGCYRPVKIVAPKGSVLNCEFPASVVSGNTETSPRVIDLLLSALSKAVPERVIGQSNCAACAGVFSGNDPDEARVARTGRKLASFIDVHGGGMGARYRKDGVSAIRVYVGNAGAQSVEAIEQTYPLRIQEWSLVPDSGGAGRQRGGLAARRVYEVLYDEATFTVSGGYGPPSERDRAKLLDDLADGYVTAEAAQRDYGLGSIVASKPEAA
ncbi:hydantoinase B/oxoprolinase family protein [Mesorhizobium sp.]|uniref:hydantoinase B/oxoprolinase family protein n=1 Tax=Mesorhizobium sp. TaxID=1871066 RepID=UPI000FE509D3|nr:hydantoinase B/oxoprolinase family protein [Mesorhizobium sp.]RWL61094.1 MAG: hydantoinase B/oxoprolinase family protein [Mesorhizobium sp.]